MQENLLVIQGGGPTSVVNASLAAILREEQMLRPKICIYGARFGMEGLASHNLLRLDGMSGDALDRLRDSPGAALGSSRFAPTEADLESCLAVMRNKDVRQVIFIGGNGTMGGARRFSLFCSSQNYNLQVIGAPKTIDNDIRFTDRCPGFGSAARFVAQSTLNLAADVRSLPQPVSIFETLGRDVGWLAASAVLARSESDSAPHLICIPEVPFDLQRFLDGIDSTVTRLGWAVAVVSEGIRYADGQPVFEQIMPTGGNIPSRPLIGGVAQYLSGIVAQRLRLRCRSEKPGLIGRSCVQAVSRQDLHDAELTGREAVRALAAGEHDRMVSLLPLTRPGGGFHLVPLQQAAGPGRGIPREWLCDGAIPVLEAFSSYLKPIVGPLQHYGTPLGGNPLRP